MSSEYVLGILRAAHEAGLAGHWGEVHGLVCGLVGHTRELEIAEAAAAEPAPTPCRCCGEDELLDMSGRCAFCATGTERPEATLVGGIWHRLYSTGAAE